MTESILERFEILQKNSRKQIQARKPDNDSHTNSHDSSKSSSGSSTSNYDWHRLLIGRLRPGVTGKYRTNKKTGNTSEILSNLSVEDKNVRLCSYANESLTLTNYKMIDQPSPENSISIDTSLESSLRRDYHFIKNASLLRRPLDNITSLKRRVRKQQMRHCQFQTQIVEETFIPISTPSNVFLTTFTPSETTQRRYKSNRSNFVVPLPPISTNRSERSKNYHNTQFDLCAY